MPWNVRLRSKFFHCDITSSIVYILSNSGGKQRQLFTSPFEMFIV